MGEKKYERLVSLPPGESPHPDGLKTHELRKGMRVRYGNRPAGCTYTILEEPGEKWVKAQCHPKGFEPHEEEMSLADTGCQPYENGLWNPSNWLEEVT